MMEGGIIKTKDKKNKKKKLIDLSKINITYQKVVEFGSLLVLLGVIVSVLIFSVAITYFVVPFKVLSYVLIAYGVVAIILYLLGKVKNFKFSKMELFIFLLMILTTLSLFGAINMEKALWGYVNRCEGLFVILSYYAYLLLSTNIKKDLYRKIIVYTMFCLAIANIIYGFFQTGILKNNGLDIRNPWHYAKGFNGNSMFYGSLLSICYPIVVGLFIKNKKAISNVVFIPLIILFTYGVVNSGSMAVFVGCMFILLLSFISVLIDIIKERSKENIWQVGKYVCVVLLFVTSVLALKDNNKLESDVKDLFKETASVAVKNKVDEKFGTGRIHIWKETLPMVKKHWLFGIGVDNYLDAFNPPVVDVVSGLVVDKAHNEYLQKALCEGVFSAIFYIIFLIVVFFKSIKVKDKYLYGLFLGFTCYSIQAFFSISVIRVGPIFYIVTGLLVGNIIHNSRMVKDKNEKSLNIS